MSAPTLADWIGRTARKRDVIRPAQVAALAATLDWLPAPLEPGSALAPGWHWIFFHDALPMSDLGHDGHGELGGFLPPVRLPRRMWASGLIEISTPLHIAEIVDKTSTVRSVTEKQGHTGPLVFVEVEHTFTGDAGGDMREVHTIVYRDSPGKGDIAPSPRLPEFEAEWSREIEPDPVQLFRYSALTFNGHRIHYDVDFCRNEEGYEGLVVHGPLTATLLMEAARKIEPDRPVMRFEFRATSPLFHTHPFTLNACCAKPGSLDLWAANHRGELAMTATAKVR